MTKAIYRMLKSAIWFYKKLRADVEANGFIVNDYDSCVTNKIVNVTQMTVAWHVDDLEVSHKGQSAIEDFVIWLRSKYERKYKELFLTYHKGRVHDYLNIDLDYTKRGKN